MPTESLVLGGRREVDVITEKHRNKQDDFRVARYCEGRTAGKQNSETGGVWQHIGRIACECLLRASGISSELITEYQSSHRGLIIMSKLRIKTEDFSVRGIRIWKCFKSESLGELIICGREFGFI